MAELSRKYRAAAEERYGKGGGSASAVAKRGIEYAKEHPVETAAYIGTGGVIGAGVKWGAKQLITKLPKLSKKIRTALGSKKIKKTEFKGTKDKSAAQQAEEARNKYEKVVLRKEIKIDKRFKKGNINRKKRVTVGSYEPTWTAVAAQQAPKVKAVAGTAAVGYTVANLLTGKPTTVGAAEYPDQPAKDDSVGKITTDKKKSKAWTTTGDTGGAFDEKLYRGKNKKVTMTSTVPAKGEINFATGKPRNNTSTVDAKSINKNKPSYSGADEIISDMKKVQTRSVASNYTRTKDNRGTRVESTSPQGNRKQSNAQLKRNGVVKSKTTTKKKKLHGSEIFKRRLGGVRGY